MTYDINSAYVELLLVSSTYGKTMNTDTFNADTNALIAQLQQQQALFTQALRHALEGIWTGADSVEAILYALDPNMTGQVSLDVPVTQAQYAEGEPPKA